MTCCLVMEIDAENLLASVPVIPQRNSTPAARRFMTSTLLRARSKVSLEERIPATPPGSRYMVLIRIGSARNSSSCARNRE